MIDAADLYPVALTPWRNRAAKQHRSIEDGQRRMMIRRECTVCLGFHPGGLFGSKQIGNENIKMGIF